MLKKTAIPRDRRSQPVRVHDKTSLSQNNRFDLNASDLKVSPTTPRASRISLRAQLLRTILPLVLFPLLIASAIGFEVVQQRTTDRIQRQLEDQALLTSEGTSTVLEDFLDIPSNVAQNPLVINEVLAGTQQTEAGELNQRSIAELESQFRQTKFLRSHQRLNAYLKDTVKTAEIVKLLITDRYGLNVAASQVPTDFVQWDELWWQQGMRAGQWISPPDFDFAAKSFTIDVVQVIPDPQSKATIGVVRAVIPARKFSLLTKYVQRTGISGTQRVQLIDAAALSVIDTFSPQGFRRDRQIIGGEPLEQVLTALRKLPPPIDASSIGQSLSAQLRLHHLVLQDLTLKSLEDSTVLISFTHGQKQYKVATIPKTNWVAIASMDQAEMGEAGYGVLQIFGLTLLVLGGITTGLILMLARQLSQPLCDLANATNQAAAGNLTTVSEPDGTLETQRLAQAFNQLVLRIKGLLRQHETEILKAQLFTEITGMVAETPSSPQLYAQILEKTRELLSIDRLVFYRISANGAGFVAAEAVGSDCPFVSEVNLSALKASQQVASVLSLAHQAGRLLPYYTEQPASEQPVTEQPDPLKFSASLQVQASLVVPICSQAELLGILIGHTYSNPHHWTDAEIDTVQQLAVQFKLLLDRSKPQTL